MNLILFTIIFKTKIKKTTKQLYFSVKFYVQPLLAKQFINNFSGFSEN